MPPMIDPPADRAKTRGAKPRNPDRKAVGALPSGTPGDERVRSMGTEFPPSGTTAGKKPTLTSSDADGRAAKNRAKNGAVEDAERAAKERRRERYANRRLLWRISEDKAVKFCGRGVLDSSEGVTIKQQPGGGAAYHSGTVRCGKIWTEPVCSAKIRAERADEIGRAVAAHIQAGGTAYMVTLTARHHKRHNLKDLLDAITEAWTRLTSGAQWAGDPARGRQGERARMGIIGYIRSTEATVGIHRFGWHPHLHVVLLMGATQNPRPKVPRKQDRPDGWVKPKWDPRPIGYFAIPDPSWTKRKGLAKEQLQRIADFERMQARWERVWSAWLEKHGFRPNGKHGIRWDRIDTVKDAETLGAYLAKTQDGKHVGHEIARGDVKTDRVNKGNKTPFQLLTYYRQLRDMSPDEMDGLAALGRPVEKELALVRAYWREWEEATRGRRAIEWSRDLRPALGLGADDEEPTDEEIVAAEEHGDEVAHLSAPTWDRVCRLGMDHRVLEAVEAGGFAALVELLAHVHLTAEHPAERRAIRRAQHGRLVKPPGTSRG